MLDKFADVKIADFLKKKNNPEGSVSWQWIDACIEKGDTCDQDKYKIPTGEPRRPGLSSTGPKGTRTPFTPNDDKILIEWVLEQEAAGAYIKGNTIYDKLAAEVSVFACRTLI